MSAPSEHLAAFIAGKGEKPKISSRSTPKPKDDEVLIKVTATAINPVDWKMQEWGVFVNEWPVILGSDAAGEIAAIGSKVKDFKLGDRVFFQGIVGATDHATFQQYTVMPADLVGHTPNSVSDEQAAGTMLAIMAATVALYHESGIDIQPHPWKSGGNEAQRGKSIIILGGSSSVGQYAIQFARLSGFSNIITNSSPSHHNHLQDLGATVILDRNSATPKDYAEAAKSYPLGAVLNCISTLEANLQAVEILQAINPNGVPPEAGLPQSTAVFLYTEEEQVKNAAKASGKAEVAIKVVWGIGSAPYLRPTATELIKALSGEDGYFATGKIQPNRPLVIKGGLEALSEALEKNKKGVSGQKVIIKPNGD